MSTIVYALCGTGRGHVSRAVAVAEALRARGHRVVFAAGDPNAAELPGEVFGVPPLRQVVRANRVRLAETARANWPVARYSLDTAAAAARWLARLGAHAVVADHEPFVGRAAARLGLPVVVLSRQAVLTEALHETRRGEALSAWGTARGIGFLAPPATAVLVPTFAPPRRRPGSCAVFLPPILRDDVIRTRATRGDRVLVYLNEGAGMGALLRELGSVDAAFDVFGVPHAGSADSVPPNVTLRPPGRDAFLARLGASRAVVATAGFTLLSEALHLGKPVLAVPNQGFFEQAINARALVSMQRGEAVAGRALRAADVAGFLGRAAAYARPHAPDGYAGREAAADAIERVLAGASSPATRPSRRGPRLS